jgi:hypothetical protein
MRPVQRWEFWLCIVAPFIAGAGMVVGSWLAR